MEEVGFEKELIGTNLGRFRSQSRQKRRLIKSRRIGAYQPKFGWYTPLLPGNSREDPGVPGENPWYARDGLGA